MKINMHTSHPSAFISSTFLDLESERKAVANVLREFNMNINALDIKPASSGSSRNEIITGIKESDFLVLIVGERYGSIIPQMTNSDRLSITKWEYLYAINHFKKDVLVYFKNVKSDDEIFYDDKYASDYNIKRKLLNDFKKKLSERHSPKYFSTIDELEKEIKNALIPIYRGGIKRLINENEKLRKDIETLRSSSQSSSAPNIQETGLGDAINRIFSTTDTSGHRSNVAGFPAGLVRENNTTNRLGGGLLDLRDRHSSENNRRSGLLGLIDHKDK
ncbi:MAG: DUF4062 domain-containing protein [Gammaproteobacteria bacterium]|nr:DUF4062 domain-containing protein [Gammaproteobacteria bacterium]